MTKIWDKKFAEAGDKQVIPVPVQAGGSLSVIQGWPSDYELPKTDPSYKPVGRAEMNGVLFEATDSIQQLQLQGAAEWSSLLGAYPKGAEVIHIGERWRSTAGGNTGTPGTGPLWVISNAVPAATETVSGIAKIATQAIASAGTNDTDFLTSLKVKLGFSISLGVNGYVKFPNILGGIIFQWATGAADPANNTEPVQTVTLPFTYPAANLINIVSIKLATASSGADCLYQEYASTNSSVSVQRQVVGGSGNDRITNPKIFSIGY